jgi:hypothetical protein
MENSTTAIQALNGCLLPGATQPLLVRYADSPAEKAAKAARKERLSQRNGVGPAVESLALQEQIQKQILELVSRTLEGHFYNAPPNLLLTRLFPTFCSR